MTDLEMVKVCAEEVTGLKMSEAWNNDLPLFIVALGMYDPLINDAQAMALIKHCGLTLWRGNSGNWYVDTAPNRPNPLSASTDLNRAIVVAVSKMIAQRGAQ